MNCKLTNYLEVAESLLNAILQAAPSLGNKRVSVYLEMSHTYMKKALEELCEE